MSILDLNLKYVFVNVELEVGLNNPFVSEYPIARLATEYPNVEGGGAWRKYSGWCGFNGDQPLWVQLVLRGELIKFEPGLNSLLLSVWIRKNTTREGWGEWICERKPNPHWSHCSVQRRLNPPPKAHIPSQIIPVHHHHRPHHHPSHEHHHQQHHYHDHNDDDNNHNHPAQLLFPPKLSAHNAVTAPPTPSHGAQRTHSMHRTHSRQRTHSRHTKHTINTEYTVCTEHTPHRTVFNS